MTAKFTLKTLDTSKGAQYFKAYGRYGNQTFTSFRNEAKEFDTEDEARFFAMGLLNTKVSRTWTVVKDADNAITVS